jgi:hypothetical protein
MGMRSLILLSCSRDKLQGGFPFNPPSRQMPSVHNLPKTAKELLETRKQIFGLLHGNPQSLYSAERSSEGNTKLDLAFGFVVQREGTDAGIAYGPSCPESWACFVEAKCLSDCSTAVSYHPLRNQLARVIENALCFQRGGEFPKKVFFTLLTPRLFLEHRNARLYGYKMSEYLNSELLIEDIERCCIPWRNQPAYSYPNIQERVGALRLNWVCYEELLEPQLGTGLDIVRRPDGVAGFKERILNCLDRRVSRGFG